MNDIKLETERLLLRPFVEDDFEAVHAYGSNIANVKFMPFGPNTKEETRDFINRTLQKAQEDPRKNYDFATLSSLWVNFVLLVVLEIHKSSVCSRGWLLLGHTAKSKP